IDSYDNDVGRESTNLDGGFRVRGSDGSFVNNFASPRTPS
ncbi:unnamed protein product, partial [Rotaria magnacalcarata]